MITTTFFKKISLFLTITLVSTYVHSQIKIGDNPTTINPNSVLEMESTNKGMLLPRLALTGTNAFAPLTAHVAGMVVYNTVTAGTAPNDVAPGYYYNDGTKWVRLASAAASAGALNTTASSLITITNGTGATFTAMVVGVDTTALKSFLNNKIQVTTTAPITGDGTAANPISVTRNNTTQGQLITITNGTNATFTAMTVDVDTTALKAFINNKTTNTLTSVGNILTSIVNGVSANDTIINSHVVTFNGNILTSSVNGVSDTAILANSDSTTASNGLTMTGKDVKLGGTLTAATTVTTSATNTIKFTGLQNGTVKDSILVQDSATGVMKKIAASSLLAGATTNLANSAGNIHTSTVNGVTDTALIINNNTLTKTGYLVTSNVNGVTSSITLPSDSTTANNGLTKTGFNTQLGGALVQSTTITTTGTNTLALSGLTSGSASDSVVVADPSTGVLKRVAASTLLKAATTNVASSAGNIHTSNVNGISDTTTIINSNVLSSSGNIMTSNVNGVSSNDTIINSHVVTFNGNILTSNVNGVSDTAIIANADSTTASNGLTMTGKEVKLGGALTGATDITTTATNTLKISGLQNGATNDSILVLDSATGVLQKISSSAFLAGATTHTLNSAGNTMTSVVNGVSANDTIITNNTLSKSGYTVTSSINGVTSSITLPSDSTTANNGLTKTGFNTQLGGVLVQATTVTTSATNTIKFAGLQNGTVKDSILVQDSATGVMKKIAASSLLAGATTNLANSTGNIHTSTVNGVTDTAKIINLLNLNSANNDMMINVNGVLDTAAIINSNIITANSDQLITDINGVNAVFKPLPGTITTKFLGFNAAGDLVIDTASTFTTHTLNSTGNIMTSVVNGVSANDTIITSNIITLTNDTLTTTVNGVVSNKVGINAVEPWNSTVTNVGAKSNSDSVYIMGKVGIATSTPNSTLSVNGSMSTAARKVAASTSADVNDFTVLINCTSAAFTLTLPAATACNGRIYRVGKSDNTFNVLTFSQSLFLAETVSFTTLNYNRMFTIQSIGGQWWVINQQ